MPLNPNAMKHAFALMALVAILLLGCRKNDPEITTSAALEEMVAEEMDRQHIPALSMLIFRQDAVLYEKCFGYANLRNQVSLAPDHMFLIASISKVITGVALLQLYENGRLDLDDPVSDYLPFAVNVPGSNTAVTFRMLLTHSSAIADNDDVLDQHYFYNQDPPGSLRDFLQGYLVPGGADYDENKNFHDFEPGSAHEYSNVGSALVGLLVEEIAGIDFNTYCKDSIFAPLGMAHTSWRLGEITQTIVTPYDYRKRENQAIRHYTNTDYPNGGLRTTTRDLHKLAAMLGNRGLFGSARLLESATVTEMITSQLPDIADEAVGLHMFEMNAEYGLWGHDGGEQGVATTMAFHPTSQLGVIIFTNQGEADLDDMLVRTYEYALTL